MWLLLPELSRVTLLLVTLKIGLASARWIEPFIVRSTVDTPTQTSASSHDFFILVNALSVWETSGANMHQERFLGLQDWMQCLGSLKGQPN